MSATSCLTGENEVLLFFTKLYCRFTLFTQRKPKCFLLFALQTSVFVNFLNHCFRGKVSIYAIRHRGTSFISPSWAVEEPICLSLLLISRLEEPSVECSYSREHEVTPRAFLIPQPLGGAGMVFLGSRSQGRHYQMPGPEALTDSGTGRSPSSQCSKESGRAGGARPGDGLGNWDGVRTGCGREGVLSTAKALRLLIQAPELSGLTEWVSQGFVLKNDSLPLSSIEDYHHNPSFHAASLQNYTAKSMF